jgi:hypothetical protein
MSETEIQCILADISYQDWEIALVVENEIQFLQVQFEELCMCRTKEKMMRHYCRKWRISPKITKSELVQTAFHAIMTAEEHEIRERFTYKGSAVYGPHFDVEQLAQLYRDKAWDMRVNSFSVANTTKGAE